MRLGLSRGPHSRLLSPSLGAQCGSGWSGVVRKFLEEVDRIMPTAGGFKLDAISEKYGSLRLDYSLVGATSEIDDAIAIREYVAESRSTIVCETCGSPGRMRGGPWTATRCDDHSEGRTALREDFGTCETATGRYRYDREQDDAVPASEQSA